MPPKNDDYLNVLVAAAAQPQEYALGEEVVEPGGERGVVDVVYLTLDSAINAFAVPPDWYELQSPKPATPKSGIWYSVVLRSGSVLVGQDDLRRDT